MCGQIFVIKIDGTCRCPTVKLGVTVKWMRMSLLDEGRYAILVVKLENSGLGSPCKCPGLMVGVHVFGAHGLHEVYCTILYKY